jgi:hypothetical protein
MSLANEHSETIMNMFIEGHSLEVIHQKTGVTLAYLKRNFATYCRPRWQKPLGHKDGPYYESEDEMFKEPVYTYKTLSKSEKAIYDDMAGDT